MTPFASVAMLEKLALLKIARLQGPRLEQRLFRLLARGVVGANQQIADDGVLRVAQRRDRHHRPEPAPILADVGQLVDVLDPARGLEHQGLEARRDRGSELDAQRFGARDQLLRIGNVGRRDLVHHFGGRVAQHPLGADVEDLNDALRVGGDAREVGAVENRALQGPGLELGGLGDADPRLVVSIKDGVAPGNLYSSHLADRLHDFKITLRAGLQQSLGADVACTAYEGSARLQQTELSVCR